jgi:hypothetical protein
MAHWEGEKPLNPESDPMPNPFPFSREGRLFQRLEHEQQLSAAVNKVAALQARRSELLRGLRELKGARAS